MVLSSYMDIFVGYAAACIFGDNITATTFFPLIVSPLLILGMYTGFLIDVRSIPIYFKIFTPLSWFKYSYEAHLIVLLRPINEIKGDSPMKCQMISIWNKSKKGNKNELVMDFKVNM
ncbi:unnamed protein product [Angiostrongylus costaricensis]|uniref:ABC2_membrane domain-containing protein n=1 Tax=Angiostrongylus costaricensis TaxID=334426 RepID=A0A0R3PNE0_ANGCS|nr:unnamed protein product [Angiostrongylus costaricensis]